MNEHTVGVWAILTLPIILGGKILIHIYYFKFELGTTNDRELKKQK